MAIGYAADPARMAEAVKERDLTPRQRRRLSKFVFAGYWGQPSSLALQRDTRQPRWHEENVRAAMKSP